MAENEGRNELILVVINGETRESEMGRDGGSTSSPSSPRIIQPVVENLEVIDLTKETSKWLNDNASTLMMVADLNCAGRKEEALELLRPIFGAVGGSHKGHQKGKGKKGTNIGGWFKKVFRRRTITIQEKENGDGKYVVIAGFFKRETAKRVVVPGGNQGTDWQDFADIFARTTAGIGRRDEDVAANNCSVEGGSGASLRWISLWDLRSDLWNYPILAKLKEAIKACCVVPIISNQVGLLAAVERNSSDIPRSIMFQVGNQAFKIFLDLDPPSFFTNLLAGVDWNRDERNGATASGGGVETQQGVAN
ncbi:hypothetical protein IFM89_019357 [Coptis chinensis]|uniref:Uncharacterized protein n=1 Tax=Coptis chinensis TaxID=261450 RepID=A0A835IXF7_9MAGN|nr:hypothetical protein IFM89_019357 [Coptis chinensis]